MSLEQAHRITDFIHEHRVSDILELGFAHGVSTCYMAAALAEAEGGSIVTIDRESASRCVPNIEYLLKECGYHDMVTYYYEPTSYTWRLMKSIEENAAPRFDLCYIDGAHTWFVDGFAFFLVDRLLRPGGWIIFDDLDWTYATSPSLRDIEQIQSIPLEERETPQIRKVYELLVKPHPHYNNFRTQDGWAYAQKINDTITGVPTIRQETVVVAPKLSNILHRFRKH